MGDRNIKQKEKEIKQERDVEKGVKGEERISPDFEFKANSESEEGQLRRKWWRRGLRCRVIQ